MALRYEIDYAVQEALLATVTIGGTPTARKLYMVTGVTANVTVLDLSGNVLTLYAGETGASTIANPTTASTTTGAVEGWVATPDYDVAVSGTGIASYTQNVRQSPHGQWNVKAYGAKSDGATNDNTKIQAAYTACSNGGGGYINFPPTGTYVNSGALTVPTTAGIKLIGGGLASIPTVAVPVIASASTLSLLPNAGMVWVSGTTGITAITPYVVGESLTLAFQSTVTVTDGGSLILAGNFTSTANDTLTLKYDGSNWIETARSVN